MTDPRIKHIVVLMLENRSFDHVLGLLKRENPDIRGFVANEYSNTAGGVSHDIGTGAAPQGQLSDPGHEFIDVNVQMFGNSANPPTEPDMSGFAANYEAQEGAGTGGAVMKCFEPQQLPVLSALARSYAICDAWFSSVPGPTLPNRAFAHFGTSFGRLDMSPEYFRAQPSVYQRLRQAGKGGKIFYFDQASGTQGLTFLLSDQADFFGMLGDFKAACKKNKLPDYSFVEPNYKDHGGMLATDQHPDNNVVAGDNFIREIYEAIRSNDATWKSTLLLIVWDEHGGLYDHVPPPRVQHSDGFESTSPAFKFDRLGVRVPAVVVSPYINPGTVDHTVYEHASIPATVTEQFIGPPQANSPYEREKWAATFLHLLQDITARNDTPSFAGVRPVPPPPAAAQPISSLISHQLAEMHKELAQNHPAVARDLDVSSVTTHEEAAAFTERAMSALHPGAARQAVPKKTTKRRSVKRSAKRSSRRPRR